MRSPSHNHFRTYSFFVFFDGDQVCETLQRMAEIIDEVNEEVLKCFTEEEVTALKNALRIIADGSHFK